MLLSICAFRGQQVVTRELNVEGEHQRKLIRNVREPEVRAFEKPISCIRVSKSVFFLLITQDDPD